MESSVLEQVVASHAPRIQRFNVRQFHRMLQQGILREGEPIELIDGLLVRKDRGDQGGNPMTHGPRHALGIKRLQRLVERFNPFGCHLQIQLPVTLSDLFEPEPDGAVVRGTPEDFRDRLPGATDTLAVIEIADSSLDYDRTTKQQMYAQAGIPTYWIVNIPERTIEVYGSPLAAAGRYRQRTDFRAGDTVRLELAEGRWLDVAVDEVLP